MYTSVKKHHYALDFSKTYIQISIAGLHLIRSVSISKTKLLTPPPNHILSRPPPLLG